MVDSTETIIYTTSEEVLVSGDHEQELHAVDRTEILAQILRTP